MAISMLIDRVQFQRCDRLDAMLEGNSAAVRWRLISPVDGNPPVTI